MPLKWLQRLWWKSFCNKYMYQINTLYTLNFYNVCVCVCVCARTCVQSCPTLYNPINCSPPGSSVHGIKLTSFASPALAGRFFITCATWKAKTSTILYVNYMSIKMEKVVTMVKLVCFTIKKSVSL